MSAGVGQYPSLYSSPVHPESGKWDALVKASESLLKEKELIIDRQVVLIIVCSSNKLINVSICLPSLGAMQSLVFRINRCITILILVELVCDADKSSI